MTMHNVAGNYAIDISSLVGFVSHEAWFSLAKQAQVSK